MRQKLINQARSLECSIHIDPIGYYLIKILNQNRELLLREQESNKWLLVSNQVPQAILKTKEVSEFLNQLSKTTKKQFL